TSLEAFLRFSGKLIFYLATACGARGKFLQKFCREFCDSRINYVTCKTRVLKFGPRQKSVQIFFRWLALSNDRKKTSHRRHIWRREAFLQGKFPRFWKKKLVDRHG
ncbi:MAG: hypothetical protein LBT98_03955, partial [Puniceicoccales bacterium]|nr:hypothetical protein [Puniceicoccales bacterium]